MAFLYLPLDGLMDVIGNIPNFHAHLYIPILFSLLPCCYLLCGNFVFVIEQWFEAAFSPFSGSLVALLI
jgi:hypothetical protein